MVSILAILLPACVLFNSRSLDKRTGGELRRRRPNRLPSGKLNGPTAETSSMIRYKCPRCKSILESPDAKAGDKVACPKCQQRLQIPMPLRDKTMLAPLVSPPPTSPRPQAIPVGSPSPGTAHPPTPVPGSPDAASNPPAGSNRSRGLLLVAVPVALLAGLLCICGVAFFTPGARLAKSVFGVAKWHPEWR